LIELKQGSIVKQYPANIAVPLKLATATLAFLLLTILLTGRTDETQIALPVIEEEAVAVYSETPDEEIDYDELLNRIPLRKPTPKPAWLDWTSEKKQTDVLG
jgi:hypothetical protein